MSANDVDRLARERRDADQRYNDALTAVDRALVSAYEQPSLGRETFETLGSALIIFLQQITAFVESKDRELAAALGARASNIERTLEAIAELRTQISVLQRRVQSIDRASGPAPGTDSAPGTRHPAPGTDSAPVTRRPAAGTADEVVYVGFEDHFRGSEDAIRERLCTYVPIFAGRQDVIDLGCGRGELLAALGDAGIRARGVDANAEMAAIARERGLDAVHGDALAFVASLADTSIGGAVATQVVEHLEPPYLLRLLDALSRKLQPGAPIVIETINPACWLAFFSSYLRDLTHVRPVHPETLQYLLRASGFTRVEVRYSAPVPEHMKMKTVDLPDGAGRDAALQRLAHTVNANAVILNNLMFTHLDYAAVGYR